MKAGTKFGPLRAVAVHTEETDIDLRKHWLVSTETFCKLLTQVEKLPALISYEFVVTEDWLPG